LKPNHVLKVGIGFRIDGGSLHGLVGSQQWEDPILVDNGGGGRRMVQL